MDTENQLTHIMGIKVLYSIWTKIHKAENLQADYGGCQPDSGDIVR